MLHSLQVGLVWSEKSSFWECGIHAFWKLPHIWPCNERRNLVLPWLFRQAYTLLNQQEVVPFLFRGCYLLVAGPTDLVLLLLFPPNIYTPLGAEQAQKTANSPPWKSCQPEKYKAATRLTNFRPENGSLATFQLFMSSLCKLLSSQFLDLALWVYRMHFEMLTSAAGCCSSQRMTTQPFRVKHPHFALLL